MCGGGVAANKGYFIQPTVFGDVQDNMTIAREEVGRSGRCQSESKHLCDAFPGWVLTGTWFHLELEGHIRNFLMQELQGGVQCVWGLRSDWIASIFCCRFLVR